MKKSFIYIISAAMALSMTACSSKTAEPETTVAVESEVETESTAESEDANVPAETEATDAPAESGDAPAADMGVTDESADSAEDAAGNESNTSADGSVAQALLADFEAQVSENNALTAQEIADALLTNEVILFSGVTMPVEEGLLMGFDNAEITGFDEGVMFAPVIGSIPFVGYVFDLPDDANADDFIAVLEENANPRWNICTEAEETVVESAGDKVFFVMSPISFEE